MYPVYLNSLDILCLSGGLRINYAAKRLWVLPPTPAWVFSTAIFHEAERTAMSFLLERLLLSDSSRGRNIDSCLTILQNMLQYPATVTHWLRSSPELLRVSAHWELKRTGSYRATCLNANDTQFHHIMTIFCILYYFYITIIPNIYSKFLFYLSRMSFSFICKLFSHVLVV